MSKEEIAYKIEQIAHNAAFDGLNADFVEREAEKLADEILDSFPIIDQKELLCDFFMFFRANGESNIGMSIEQFVDCYMNK